MNLSRLNVSGLHKILSGQVKKPATCVIKFYSNNCPYCHNFKEYFEEIAAQEEYADLYFFVFNVGDYPIVEKKLNFNGVPTIVVIKTGSAPTKVKVCPEPENPHSHTWYNSKEVQQFIEEHRK